MRRRQCKPNSNIKQLSETAGYIVTWQLWPEWKVGGTVWWGDDPYKITLIFTQIVLSNENTDARNTLFCTYLTLCVHLPLWKSSAAGERWWDVFICSLFLPSKVSWVAIVSGTSSYCMIGLFCNLQQRELQNQIIAYGMFLIQILC